MYDSIKPADSYCFIGEFRKNKESADGIYADDLKRIVSQIDLSALPSYEKYELSLTESCTYDKHNLNLNEYQKNIIKFIFKNGTLHNLVKNTLSGKFLLITVSGFDNGTGETVAYIFYEQ